MLYGVFALLHGSLERGYGGRSIFFAAAALDYVEIRPVQFR